MRTVRFGPGATAADIRALTPAPRDVEADVRGIVEEVRAGGDNAVRRLTERFDHAELAVESLLVPLHEIEAAVSTLEPDVLRGLKMAAANVRQVATAGMSKDSIRVELPERQVVELAEVPVRRAAAYVPGGRAPYPSTVVMCATVANVAGVDELAVCAPPGPEGRAHPTILAACALCDVTEVYRMGGAQAIAAMAYGTETIPPVDVIVGPGNAYVTEAKRQVNGVVGIDGLAGPSELVVLATPGAEHELLALDLLAQAEHGEGSLVVAVSPDPQLLDAIVDCVEELAAARPTVADAPFAAVLVADAAAALRLADEIAPEHLELAGTDAEGLQRNVRAAGCVFVGRDAATAFGDYVAGSNHVLPTGGAARFASGLSPATFRRRMARVSLPPGAAARLAPHGAAVARAEGFQVHGESMERRA
ncbi:MAG: histidinol dehydrogenase [Thermoleophilaceae bacterium]|nr:histidinol dehydrogenase [Thermoleophilaceae bacterium]